MDPTYTIHTDDVDEKIRIAAEEYEVLNRQVCTSSAVNSSAVNSSAVNSSAVNSSVLSSYTIVV